MLQRWMKHWLNNIHTEAAKLEKHSNRLMTIIKKSIPYAVGNFEELREANYHMVDKTGFLSELETYKIPDWRKLHRY